MSVLVQRLRAAFGPASLEWVVFAVVAVAHLVPLWAVRFLPFMDLPQHLAAISVLNGLGDEETGFAAYFFTDLGSTPYLAYYLATDLLAQFCSVETANRLFLSLYVVLLPLGARSFLRAFGREPLLALLAFPVTYGTFLFMGFINFVTALPFLLFGLGAVARFCRDGGRWPFVGMVVNSVLLFFSHTQVFLLYFGSAGLYVLLAWPGWRRVGLAALHIVPTLVLLVLWIAGSQVLAGEESWREGNMGRNASPAGAEWEDLGVSLRELPGRLVDAYRDGTDDFVVILLGFAVVLLLLFRRPPETHGVRAWLREHAIELVSVVLLGLYFVLPTSFKWIWPLNWRLAPVVFLVGLPWLRLPPLGSWWRAALAVPLAALALHSANNHYDKFRLFQDEVGPLTEVLAQAEPRRRLMGLIFDKGSGVMTHTLAPYIHFAQYYPVWRGGMADFSFANFAQSPVRFHERTGPPKLPVRWEWTPERLRYPDSPAGVAGYYDYYLVRAQGWPRKLFKGYLGFEVKEVARAGRWWLLERVWEASPSAP